MKIGAVSANPSANLPTIAAFPSFASTDIMPHWQAE
jgi:hypothetical protein